MFKIGDQELSNQDVAQACWDRMKNRMEWCRKEAADYLKNNGRRKFYKIAYSVDSGDQVTYSAISDEDRKKIEEGYNKFIAEEGPFEDSEERAEALNLFYEELDIDLEKYLPEYDLHWAGGLPTITDIDFDDVIHCCKFKVLHTQCFNDNQEELNARYYNLEISDDEFVDLLTARLFDENLTFYDLKSLHEDVFNKVNDMCHKPHRHYVIFMTEINQIAQEILDGKTKEELPKTISSNPFTAMALNQMFNNKSITDEDPQLLKVFRLATYEVFSHPD